LTGCIDVGWHREPFSFIKDDLMYITISNFYQYICASIVASLQFKFIKIPDMRWRIVILLV
jgi:hypothetical protein